MTKKKGDYILKQKIKLQPGRGFDCYTLVSVATDSITDLAHKNNVDVETKICKKGKSAIAVLNGENDAVKSVVSICTNLSEKVFLWKKCYF